MDRTLSERIEAFNNERKLHSNEGRRGVEKLAQIVRQIGYEDFQYYGQFRGHNGNTACLGDIFTFLEDNPGAIEALITWIGDQDLLEWKDEFGYDDEDES